MLLRGTSGVLPVVRPFMLLAVVPALLDTVLTWKRSVGRSRSFVSVTGVVSACSATPFREELRVDDASESLSLETGVRISREQRSVSAPLLGRVEETELRPKLYADVAMGTTPSMYS